MRILLVVSDPDGRRDPALRAATLEGDRLRPATRVDLIGTRTGPSGHGTPFDSVLTEIATLDAACGAADDGYEAVVLDDPADPALDALRSRLGIAVVGAAMASVWLARLIGQPLAVVSTADRRAA